MYTHAFLCPRLNSNSSNVVFFGGGWVVWGFFCCGFVCGFFLFVWVVCFFFNIHYLIIIAPFICLRLGESWHSRPVFHSIHQTHECKKELDYVRVYGLPDSYKK